MSSSQIAPIFIVGTGRCGSTTIFERITLLEHVAWLSALADKHPDRPELGQRLLRSVDIPGAGPILRRRFNPSEAYRFWERHVPGFANPIRDLTASDVMPGQTATVNRVLQAMTTGRRQRFVVKLTGWPRILFLKEMFPDAKFVHIVRDGRAVAFSLLNVDWWTGWRGPSNWRFGPIGEAATEEWISHGRSFIYLAGLQWRLLIDAFETALAGLRSEDYLVLRYEDFCADSTKTYRRLFEFAGWPRSAVFERSPERFQMRNMNHKWEDGLNDAQKAILHDSVKSHLRRFGYM